MLLLILLDRINRIFCFCFQFADEIENTQSFREVQNAAAHGAAGRDSILNIHDVAFGGVAGCLMIEGDYMCEITSSITSAISIKGSSLRLTLVRERGRP